MTPREIIDLRAPEYAGETRVDDLITFAETKVKENWGDDRSEAIALLVLHWLTVQKMNGGDQENSGSGLGGFVSSRKEGDLQEQRELGGSSGTMNLSADDLHLLSTQWGQEYIALRAAVFVLPRNRMV